MSRPGVREQTGGRPFESISTLLLAVMMKLGARLPKLLAGLSWRAKLAGEMQLALRRAKVKVENNSVRQP